MTYTKYLALFSFALVFLNEDKPEFNLNDAKLKQYLILPPPPPIISRTGAYRMEFWKSWSLNEIRMALFEVVVS